MAIDLEPRADERGGALWLPQSGIDAARRLKPIVGPVGYRVSEWIKKSEKRVLARLSAQERDLYFQGLLTPAHYRAVLEREAGKLNEEARSA